MFLNFKPYLLEFKHPFGVSSNTRTHTQSVFVKIMHGGFSGYGEACLPAYLGESLEETLLFLEKAKKIIDRSKPSFPFTETFKLVDAIFPGNNAAKASIDIALNDLTGKISGKPFYELAGLGKSEPRVTSCTIGIDDEKKIAKKIDEAKDFEILKIKAGTKNDKALISLIRKYTTKPLFVDVNQGWKNKEYVIEMINWMESCGVVLIEQPMPVNMMDEMAWVTERSPIPTIADESVKRLKDIDAVKGVFSGINIKLMKCAGLTEAMEMIRYGKSNNLKIMLGCMAESSCAASAMAQLMQFADYIDLDSPNLIKNDPFNGITYTLGKVFLNDSEGIGVTLKASFLNFD
jgi:L-alanine-DL-glutamate epimerase-like enolase superfamily enzyme